MKLPGRQPIVWLVALFVVVAIAIAAANRLPPPRPNAPGTFSFAVLGDAPYNPGEDRQYPHLLADLDAHDLTFVIHVGDLFGGPAGTTATGAASTGSMACATPSSTRRGTTSGSTARRTARRQRALACPRGGSRSSAARSFAESIPQPGPPPASRWRARPRPPDHADLPENTRWAQGGILFATVHLVGSRNGLQTAGAARWPRSSRKWSGGRRAATAWLRETFAQAHADAPPPPS